MDVIALSGNTDSLPQIDQDEFIDPAFLSRQQWNNGFPLPLVTNYLSHQISQNNDDLYSHVHKVYLCIKHQQSRNLYSALFDLFLVLGTKGRAFRKTLLSYSQSFLSATEYMLLEQSLPSGSLTEIALELADKSILRQELRHFSQHNFIQHHTNYIAHKSQEQTLYQKQQFLQSAIIENPRKLSLHYDLLELFTQSKDHYQFNIFYHFLCAHSSVLPNKWHVIANNLNEAA